MNLTATLEREYDRLWQTCVIRPERRAAVKSLADRVVRERRRYEAAGAPHGVPWYVVGAIHQLEASGSFEKHLHNGDPLTARTVRVPAGRPRSGNPPFSWEVSAADALDHAGLGRWRDWSTAGVLFVLERYNGFGYRKDSIRINSPYLWSFSGHYTKGKFVADGKYSATEVSGQCGAAVLLRELADRGLVPGGHHLERGTRGPAVAALKRELKAWFEANAPGEWARFRIADTDLYGAALERAVKDFQGRKGLPQTGKVDQATRTGLAGKASRAMTGSSTPAVLKRGHRGPAVRRLKRDLRAWFDATSPGEWARLGVADGDLFGAKLETAVKIFQARIGLEDDGEVGRLTREALAAAAHA